MGLLDDAIREHLELKRRAGSDAAELAKLENDAFGPIRRGEPAEEAEAPPVFEEPPPAPAAAPAFEPDFQEVAPPAPEPEVPAAAPEPPAPSPFADAPESQPTVAFTADEVAAASSAEHPPHAPDPDAPVRPGYDDEIELHPQHPEEGEREYEPDADVVPADDEPVEQEDELEETPEFLQETPEHDRLWFEQKPPRDFDF